MIKPFPFCGSKEVEILRTNENACWVRCARYGADTPSNPERKKAIAIWNRRPHVTGEARITFDGDADFIA